MTSPQEFDAAGPGTGAGAPPTSGANRARPATMRDVAQLVGVSTKTVSNVLNGRPNVGKSTREKIQLAMRDLNYRPQVAAQSMRTGSSGLITIAIPSMSGHHYFSELAQAFATEAQRRGRNIMLHSTEAGIDEERSVLGGLTRVLGDGTVFSPVLIGEEALAELEHTVQPTVFIGENIRDESLPGGSDYVRTDNRAAAHDATAHLIELGRRSIAFVGPFLSPDAAKAHSTSRLRLDGYLAALDDAGTAQAPIVCPIRKWDFESGVEGTNQLLDEHAGIDALVCSNDNVARGAMFALQHRDLSVPDDVAVIGYDNIEESTHTSPSLSTVDPDRAAIVSTVYDLLLERIGGHEGPPRIVTIPHRVLIRESTAARP